MLCFKNIIINLDELKKKINDYILNKLKFLKKKIYLKLIKVYKISL